MIGRKMARRRALRWLAMGVLSLNVSAPALAWNGAGHRLIAAIAWDNMKQEAREEASRLLRHHPDFTRWLKRAGEDETGRRLFIEASTWPDDIRKDNRFYSAGKEDPTPTLPGFPDMERRGNWHYVNIPLTSRHGAQALSGQLDRRLPELENSLGKRGADEERTYALPWLIHLVGDAHQPLHTSARLDSEGQWDKLGNSLEVSNPFNPRKPVSSLHAFWDDLPGPPWLRNEKLDAAADALTSEHRSDARGVSSRRWIEESWQIARENGYPAGGGDGPIPISEAFYNASKEIADRRVAQAGYRLADLLNRLLAPGSQR